MNENVVGDDVKMVAVASPKPSFIQTGKVRSVVVVPWHPHVVSDEELFSIKSIRRFANGAEMVIVTPDATRLPPILVPDRVEVFPEEFFKTFLANNRLMTSVAFYERFADYQQMALVHIDVLLLKPLAPLLQTLYPWSYAGAPWIGGTAGDLRLEGVGNGGFSMRRIRDFLDVLGGSTRPTFPRFTTKRRGLALWAFLSCCHIARIKGERVSHIMNRHDILEDVFWSKVAPCMSPRFTIAPISNALAFSYETFPQFAHESNHGNTPYGIHGWWRHDAKFVQSLAADLDI